MTAFASNKQGRVDMHPHVGSAPANTWPKRTDGRADPKEHTKECSKINERDYSSCTENDDGQNADMIPQYTNPAKVINRRTHPHTLKDIHTQTYTHAHKHTHAHAEQSHTHQMIAHTRTREQKEQKSKRAREQENKRARDQRAREKEHDSKRVREQGAKEQECKRPQASSFQPQTTSKQEKRHTSLTRKNLQPRTACFS